MRTLIRGIVEAYSSPKLEGQEEGFVVFRGREPDSGLPVSIRILAQSLSESPQIAERFRRLAQAIRGLNHPNISPVQKVGENAGLPYIVTRFIEQARPLAETLDQPWAVDAAADVVMQVAQALEHAHNKGVMHGDLIPEKIVIQDDGHVRVTDFGVGALLDLAGARGRLGVSPYLAPERLAGTPADARADVYSLAALLYVLLAQRPPVTIRGEMQPPSRFNPDVPAAMDQVVVRGLATDPQDRYPSVKAFLAALGAIILAPVVADALPRTEVVSCPHCGAGNQTGRFCRKCGKRLEQGHKAPVRPPAKSKLDEPIQVTQIEVSNFQADTKFETAPLTIAQPVGVTSAEMSDLFPQPLEMPQLETDSLWPTLGSQDTIQMPEPPPMPVIDWSEIAPAMPVVPSIEETLSSSGQETQDDQSR